MIICSRDQEGIQGIRLLANDHPEDLASCKWSSGGPSHLQMIIWRIRQLANDHLEDPASCKWSSRGSGLLQMIIGRIRPLANDHPADPATCKWSYGGTGHLQMIIRRIWPLANDHPEDPASCKWSSGASGLWHVIIWRDWPLTNDHPSPRHPNYLSQDPESISRTFLEQFALVGIFNLQQFFYWNLEALSFALFIFASTFTHEAVSSTGDISLFTDIHTSKRWTLRPHIHKIFESLRYGSFHQLTFLQWLWHSLSSLRNTFVADRQQ